MAESGAEGTVVPVKVPEPQDHAPPTLAEPASGPAAEMSGALSVEGTKDSSSLAADDHKIAADGDTNGVSAAASSGENEQPAPAVNPSTSEAPVEQGDTEMQDAPEQVSAAADDEEAPTSNGTPAQNKGNNGKRKSTGGIPEHKNKKLNKKKSMPKITHLDAKPGDTFFARLKSYPPWPSVICDEEMLPQSLLNTRPITTKRADGTYNEAYDDGGKKVTDRTFPIMFMYTNEFAWIPNTDLAPLDPADCKEVSQKGKAKSLLAAYEVAAEGHDLSFFKDMLADHAKALEEDEQRREAKEAEKAAKADKKGKRKSEVKPADEDVEMAEAGTEPTPKKSSKKRKKDAESDEEQPEKPAKTPKTTKLKLTTNKTPATTEKKAKEPKSAKGKSDKKKSKTTGSDEEVREAEEKEPEKPLDPVEERKAREKEVLFLRHKLQKGFLSRDQAPREDEMPQMSNYIKKLEGYADLEVAIIRATKINKVLKALVKLNTIPRDEEFQFRKRSVELLGKWNKILGSEPVESEAADKDKASPTTNGVHEEKEKSEEKTEDDKAPVEEPKDNTVEASEAVEKVSAEVPADAAAKSSVIDSLQEEPEGEKETTLASKDTPSTNIVEKAPVSAEAASEVQEAVKAAE